MLLDIVFSRDSVITAVGMAKHLWVMAAAIILAAPSCSPRRDRLPPSSSGTRR